MPERARVFESLVDGAVFGAMLLLVCFGVALGRVFRRPRLIYLALAVLAYTFYVALLCQLRLRPPVARQQRTQRLAHPLHGGHDLLLQSLLLRCACVAPAPWLGLALGAIRCGYLLLALGSGWVEPGLWQAIVHRPGFDCGAAAVGGAGQSSCGGARWTGFRPHCWRSA